MQEPAGWFLGEGHCPELSMGLGCGVKIRVSSKARTSLDPTFSWWCPRLYPSGEASKDFQNQAGHSFLREKVGNSFGGQMNPIYHGERQDGPAEIEPYLWVLTLRWAPSDKAWRSQSLHPEDPMVSGGECGIGSN